MTFRDAYRNDFAVIRPDEDIIESILEKMRGEVRSPAPFFKRIPTARLAAAAAGLCILIAAAVAVPAILRGSGTPLQNFGILADNFDGAGEYADNFLPSPAEMAESDEEAPYAQRGERNNFDDSEYAVTDDISEGEPMAGGGGDGAVPELAADSAPLPATTTQPPNESADSDVNASGESGGSGASGDADPGVFPPLYVPYDGVLGRGTIENPKEYWETYGYPDNVSYLCENEHHFFQGGIVLTYWWIGIINADEAAKQEIIDLFSITNLFIFEDAAIPYAERQAIMNKILAMEDENILDVFLILNNENIFVTVSRDNLEKYKAMFFELFGDVVWVESYFGR